MLPPPATPTVVRTARPQGKDAAIEKFAPLFDKAPFNDQDQDHFLSYEDLFKQKMDRVTAAFKVVRQNPPFMKQRVQMEAYFDHNGIFLHFSMILTYLQSQGTKAQQKYWLGRAREGSFIAAYAQTELGHGSNVRA